MQIIQHICINPTRLTIHDNFRHRTAKIPNFRRRNNTWYQPISPLAKSCSNKIIFFCLTSQCSAVASWTSQYPPNDVSWSVSTGSEVPCSCSLGQGLSNMALMEPQSTSLSTGKELMTDRRSTRQVHVLRWLTYEQHSTNHTSCYGQYCFWLLFDWPIFPKIAPGYAGSSRAEPLVTAGARFVTGQMPLLSLNHQCQSTDGITNEWIDRSIDQWTNELIDPSIDGLMVDSIDPSTDGQIYWSINWSIHPPNHRSIHQSINLRKINNNLCCIKCVTSKSQIGISLD